MKYMLKGVALIILCCLFGCASRPLAIHERPGREGLSKVIDVERLRKGGNLLIVPVRGGVGVVATEELDRVTLMIVKGASEYLQQNNTPFQILTASNANTADLIIKGHVTKFTKPGGFKKCVLMKQSVQLGVEGQLIDEQSDNLVLLFSRSISSKKSHGSIDDAAYELGQWIGSFIAGHL